jgi:hypothetical protein
MEPEKIKSVEVQSLAEHLKRPTDTALPTGKAGPTWRPFPEIEMYATWFLTFTSNEDWPA